MSKETWKRMIADLLFWVQIICTLWFGISQFKKMLVSTQGVSISWFAFWEVFLLINLVLSIRAHRNKPSWATLQTIIGYALWTIMVAADLAVMIWMNRGAWDQYETATVVLAGAGIVGSLHVAHRHNLDIADPIVKGWLAVFFKAIPQLVLAYKIFWYGGGGLGLDAVIAGHVTILCRLYILRLSIGEAGKERNRRGSEVSEITNEASWMVVTIIWLL